MNNASIEYDPNATEMLCLLCGARFTHSDSIIARQIFDDHCLRWHPDHADTIRFARDDEWYQPTGYITSAKYPDRQVHVEFSCVQDIKRAISTFRTNYAVYPEGYRRPDTICLNRAAIDQLNAWCKPMAFPLEIPRLVEEGQDTKDDVTLIYGLQVVPIVPA